jgi:tetratricopeptide (TPR) repeat protein
MGDEVMMTILKRRVLLLWFLLFSWSELPKTFLAQQSDPALLDRYFQEGEKALAERRFDEAAKAYGKLSQLDPKTAEVHAKLGLIYYQQGKFAEAVPSLRRALKLKPGLPNTDTLLGLSLSELGRYTEALPSLEKGFRHPPDSGVKRLLGLQLQRTYVGLQRYNEAAGVALELSRLYPEDPEVLYHTGRLYGDFAYLTMQRLTKLAPDSVWLHQAAGEAHESQGHHELAAREYRKVLSLDPGRPGIHFRLGRALLSNQDASSYDEAIKEFEQELQLDSTHAGAAYEMAEIYRKLGQLDRARQFFSIAIKDYPDFEEAQIGLGRVLVALKVPEEAIPHLEKAIFLNSDDEVAYYQLSLAYKALGDVVAQQKALGEFRRLRGQGAQAKTQVPIKPPDITKQELDSEVP